MVRAAVALHRRGVHVVRMNLRGAGEGVTEASSLWHAGLTSDVLAAAGALAREPRVANVVLVGFSLGGNVALKLAGEIGADVARSPVRAVAALSAPLDLDAVARRLLGERLVDAGFPVDQGAVDVESDEGDVLGDRHRAGIMPRERLRRGRRAPAARFCA